MFTRSSTSLLVGSLLVVPMMVLAGCEDFEQQGEMGETEPGVVEEEQSQQSGMETETREQRREAEPQSERPFGERTETERAERSEAERPERPDEPRTGEETGERTGAVMAMTEMQVELPAGIQSGSYDLRCPLQQEGQQQAGQQQRTQTQQEEQVVQLHITVEESGEQQGGITGQN